ncbi:MAG: hypothetical protein V4507_14985 [Verrucomicrobiota bacterium]
MLRLFWSNKTYSLQSFYFMKSIMKQSGIGLFLIAGMSCSLWADGTKEVAKRSSQSTAISIDLTADMLCQEVAKNLDDVSRKYLNKEISISAKIFSISNEGLHPEIITIYLTDPTGSPNIPCFVVKYDLSNHPDYTEERAGLFRLEKNNSALVLYKRIGKKKESSSNNKKSKKSSKSSAKEDSSQEIFDRKILQVNETYTFEGKMTSIDLGQIVLEAKSLQ